MIGITMVKVIPGHEKIAYHALREIEGIKEIYHLFGEFDFFVIMEAENKVMLNNLLAAIRGLGDVVGIWPLLISREESISEAEVASSQMGAAVG